MTNGKEEQSGDFTIRQAVSEDSGRIIEILRDLELDYPGRDLNCFLVGERAGEILAVAELKDLGELCLFSCVGVVERLQGTGLGKVFVDRVLQDVQKDVYLYTLVPGFFRKTGFEDARSLPASLPPRMIYGCAACDPASCLCLVRKADGPRVSGN